MELTTLDAIDVHVHVEQDAHGCYSLDDELMDASASYFKSSENPTPLRFCSTLNGPGAAGHGRRAVIFRPQHGS
ncbi:hypothetical protein ACFPH6_30170 [Streptomyces xiangluensis]|uniref:Uncharacterized protein n=1 Tax=Streptomyces xiangluensis TaxID=2665720 RepID=A0ABV8YXE6_9ACTN